MRGEIIGINTAIATRAWRRYMGVGFAIPARWSRTSCRICRGKEVVRGYLGCRSAAGHLRAGIGKTFG